MFTGITRLWSVATGACLRTIVLGLGGGGLGGGGGGGGGAEGAEGAEDADTAGDRLAVIPGFVGNAVDDVAGFADGVVINGGAGWGDGSYRNAPIGCIVPSTNGRYLLASTLDAHGSLRLWDAVKGRVVRTYAGRRGSRYCAFAAFADDAEGTSYAVCGSEDGSVMAWDLRTGEVAQRIPGSDAAWTNVVGDERTKAEAEKRRGGSEKAENTAKLDGDGIEPATGSPGTPGRDEEDGDAGNRVGGPQGEGEGRGTTESGRVDDSASADGPRRSRRRGGRAGLFPSRDARDVGAGEGPERQALDDGGVPRARARVVNESVAANETRDF